MRELDTVRYRAAFRNIQNETRRQSKHTLREFFAGQTDAYLVRVVDQCRAGTFCYGDKRHCVRGLSGRGYVNASSKSYVDAEYALARLANTLSDESEHIRRVRVLPMVLNEIRTRNRGRRAKFIKLTACVVR